ncbi:hypothetical protein D3C84_1279180 [compost metagenome]
MAGGRFIETRQAIDLPGADGPFAAALEEEEQLVEFGPNRLVFANKALDFHVVVNLLP